MTLLRLFTHTTVVILLLVLLFLVFCRIYLPYLTHSGKEVVVPNVTHLPLDQAVKILAGHGLRYEVIDSAWSPLQKPLTVVQHYPKASAKVKINRRIQLWLNRRIPPTVAFPELIYTSPAFAREQLEKLDLKLGNTAYRPDLAKDAVIEFRYQDGVIHAGQKIPKGSVIDIVIATAVYAEPG